ncbi:afadin [Nematolebias whitei]|uniref:afadin n=1 Tax=Nematolebias whitei TaxID=451745 RepID=UPI001899EAD2|nr:afadin [Nematolebias whitei]
MTCPRLLAASTSSRPSQNSEDLKMSEEREKLSKVIRQWNSSRLDLFEISQPDENLEFHGVIRFYFEDPLKGNVATKCLRVSSNAPSREIVETLSEKFRPDLKMLSTGFSLHEIHSTEERKLNQDEKPLIVQLNWKSDSREGHFVLKKDGDTLEENRHETEKGGVLQTFKRTLSRKGKKETSTMTDENRTQEQDLKPSQTLQEKQPELPVRLQISDNAEEAFLSAVINYTNSTTVHFKLSPAYILYAAGRFVLRCHDSRGSPSTGNVHPVTSITNKMVAMTRSVIQRQQTIVGALTFWMSNSSELLNFLQHDEDLSPLTQQSQLDLTHLVHRAYSLLLQCLQNELRKHLPTFLTDPEQHAAPPPETVLNTLTNAMSLLRRCRVNPALTIQLFSQLFHFISAWLFNQLVHPDAKSPGLRSHYWGCVLQQRLAPIEAWAERQGLELAADCHLGHIVQATTLLTINKFSLWDAENIQSACFKLNSLQVWVLLDGYLCATNEPHIPPELIDAVVGAAEASADVLIQSEGRDVRLEESLDLHLPFLLPEGGYSCDTMRGVPPGFQEFLEQICQKGLCSLTPQLKSKGDWTACFRELSQAEGDTCVEVSRQPEVETVTLHKPLNGGMGISIVAAKGAGQENVGIYVKSIVRGGAAEMSGRLAAGDQLLSVDAQSLVGLSQERAAAILMQTGPIVTLQVAKFGASYHGLGALLNGPPSDSAGQNLRKHQGGEDHPKGASTLDGVVDRCPSGWLLRGSRRQKEQRNRQLYCSDPNMAADFDLQLGSEPDDPDDQRNLVSSVSSMNLCTDTFHREYLTLPNPKSRDRVVSELSRPQQTLKMSRSPSDGPSSSSRTLMRQARSQDNLSVDRGGHLLDKRHNSPARKDRAPSFPIRSSVSTDDVLSRRSSPSKRGSHRSPAGVWRTPFSQQSTPAPSVQPMRIDIPLTRAASAQSNPPLSTFQLSSSLVQKKRNEQSRGARVHESSVPAAKKPLRPPVLWQQQRPPTSGDGAEQPRASIPPTKHVSFQEPPRKQNTTGPVKPRDHQELRDPWRREAQEKLQEQCRLQAVELLHQEVRLLRAKDERTAEENERLRRLNLEQQFQTRLQEVQSRGEEEEEEDEGLDMTVVLQRLGDQTSKTETTRCSEGSDRWEQKEKPPHIKRKDGLKHEDHVTPDENLELKTKSVPAPEKLPFRERQRLFTVASSA